MRRSKWLAALVLFVAAAAPGFAQGAGRPAAESFASDFQTVPVMGNVTGVLGAVFETSVVLFNPTASSYAVSVSLYDSTGTKREASINLAAGESKSYSNFLSQVFNFDGGGAVTFRAPDSTGGTHNNRFIVSTQVVAARYGTTIPALEFAGSSSPSFSPGITVSELTRSNVGCFNQSDLPNSVKVTVLDRTGTQVLGTQDLNLLANAWSQVAVSPIVTDGIIRFEPSEAAVCYAVVVDYTTHDGHFVPAAEYAP